MSAQTSGFRAECREQAGLAMVLAEQAGAVREAASLERIRRRG
jgi:hypothetical protein